MPINHSSAVIGGILKPIFSRGTDHPFPSSEKGNWWLQQENTSES